MWNESMDLRKGKPPMVTLHIPLLTLGAWESGHLEGCAGVQVYFLRILKYVRASLGSLKELVSSCKLP